MGDRIEWRSFHPDVLNERARVVCTACVRAALRFTRGTRVRHACSFASSPAATFLPDAPARADETATRPSSPATAPPRPAASPARPPCDPSDTVTPTTPFLLRSTPLPPHAPSIPPPSSPLSAAMTAPHALASTGGERRLPLPLLLPILTLLLLAAATPAAAQPTPRLQAAYAALQSWKRNAIFSDPYNFTSNWVGPNVCAYNGIYCAPHPTDGALAVAGIDLNHADIAGYLPADLPPGLPDLALLHLNSNRFCGVLPDTFLHLRLLHELDLSNNRFVGPFPSVLLTLPSLRYLDLRFNDIEGPIPAKLFDLPLDAIILNNNRLTRPIPANLGNSPASVVVLAHNRLGGCIPPSIGRMAATLNEIVLIDNELSGCIPPQVGMLSQLTVFDVSGNHLQGRLPASVAGMSAVQQLNVAGNVLRGPVPAAVCGLGRSLRNFTYEDNFFTSRPACPVVMADGSDRRRSVLLRGFRLIARRRSVSLRRRCRRVVHLVVAPLEVVVSFAAIAAAGELHDATRELHHAAGRIHHAAGRLHDAVRRVPVSAGGLVVDAARRLHDAVRRLPVSARGLADDAVNAAFIRAIPRWLATVFRLPAAVVGVVTVRSTRGTTSHRASRRRLAAAFADSSRHTRFTVDADDPRRSRFTIDAGDSRHAGRPGTSRNAGITIDADDTGRTRIAVDPDGSRHTRINYPWRTRVAIDADDARLPPSIAGNAIFTTREEAAATTVVVTMATSTPHRGLPFPPVHGVAYSSPPPPPSDPGKLPFPPVHGVAYSSPPPPPLPPVYGVSYASPPPPTTPSSRADRPVAASTAGRWFGAIPPAERQIRVVPPQRRDEKEAPIQKSFRDEEEEVRWSPPPVANWQLQRPPPPPTTSRLAWRGPPMDGSRRRGFSFSLSTITACSNTNRSTMGSAMGGPRDA
ncbi:hypothetical protein HU200_043243 [Digitaria exilis]|uniref:Cell wall hydroxyproline-rich glycoprotein n=1 Tax=Digitaria exilis TaxID=1010633 RepID=A0A835BBH2_9POAL|nr:hypothetical protein HU200_043243 [Digitaria exilis]